MIMRSRVVCNTVVLIAQKAGLSSRPCSAMLKGREFVEKRCLFDLCCSPRHSLLSHELAAHEESDCIPSDSADTGATSGWRI